MTVAVPKRPAPPQAVAAAAPADLGRLVWWSLTPGGGCRPGGGAPAVILGVTAGIYNQTPSPFGDWRDLAIGYLFAFALWSTVIKTDRDCLRLAQIFVAILVGYSAYQLLLYASGGGEIAFYALATTRDHASLEFMV